MAYSGPSPSLTSRETAVLQWADKGGRARVTTGDLQALFGDRAGIKVASSLARKGVLDRVGRGVYTLRPLRALASPWSSPSLVAVAHLFGDMRYYVGGPAAMALHGFTTETLTSHVDVFSKAHRRAREVGGVQLVFHRAGEWAFGFGLSRVEVAGVPVTVSDPERTVLDLLEWRERPFGIRLVARALEGTIRRVRTDRLVEYALRWPTVSTQQRLGLLLERAGADAGILDMLAARVAITGSVPSLLPGVRRIGGVHPVWRLVVNDLPDRHGREGVERA